jgi:alpha-tubulin suppressor-like RCC1 family protein
MAVLTRNGAVICWGFNNKHQCLPPEDLGSVIAVSCGDLHTAALMQDGRIICWGCNDYGRCIALLELTSVNPFVVAQTIRQL